MVDEQAPTTEPNEPTPTWLWWAAAAIVLVPVALIATLSWQLHWSWLPNLWFGYAWPSDKGNGPEALQQTVLYAALAIVLIPAVRHFLQREFHKVHEKIEAVHQTVHLHHTEAMAEVAANKKLLHHVIINSSEIPNEVPGLEPEHQPVIPESAEPDPEPTKKAAAKKPAAKTAAKTTPAKKGTK